MPLTSAEKQELAELDARALLDDRPPPSDYMPPQTTPQPWPIDEPAGGLLDPQFGGTLPEWLRLGGAVATLPFGPLAATGIGLGSEVLAGALEGQQNPFRLGLSTLPMAFSGAARLGRAGSRMMTRLMPGRFDAAHRGAQEEMANLAESFGTPEATKAAWEDAYSAMARNPGASAPIADTQAAVTDMLSRRALVPALSQGSRAADDLLNQVGSLGANPALPLEQAQAYLRELNRVVSEGGPAAAEATRLAGTLAEDIARVAQAGGPGAGIAQALRDAAAASKGERAAGIVTKAVRGATRPLNAAIGPEASVQDIMTSGGTPVLNVGNLTGRLAKHQEELERLLGPRIAEIQQFLSKYSALPPDMPAKTWPYSIGLLGAGAAGGLAGGVKGALGAAALAGTLELLQNAYRLGPNPFALNQTMNALAQGGRLGIPAMSPEAEARLRQVPQELSDYYTTAQRWIAR